MKCNSEKHHRRSIRLKNYDYSNTGAYFITVCAYNRECLFGNMQTGKIVLNQFGQIISNKWNQIPKHFLNVQLDEFIIMPNHLHGIIIIVGAKHLTKEFSKNLQYRQKNASPLHLNGTKPGSLSAIMQNFQSVTTRKINQIRKTPGSKLWQRNFFEHIIRDEKELNQVREYVINNPLEWELDKENPKNWGGKSIINKTILQ